MYHSRATTNIPFSAKALQWLCVVLGNIYRELFLIAHASKVLEAGFLAVSAVLESSEGGRLVNSFKVNITRRPFSTFLFGVAL